MNQSPNIVESHFKKDRKILKNIYKNLEERILQDETMNLDNAICYELDNCSYTTYDCGPDEVYDIIISYWPNINAKNQWGKSALRKAIVYSHFKLIKYLVENGVDTTDMDDSSRTAVMLTIRYHHPDIAIYLIEQGHGYFCYKERCSTDTVMLQAVDKGYFDVVKCLVEHGADVNLWNKDYDSPLRRAIRRGYIEIAEYLVEQDATIFITDKKSLIKEGVRNVRWRFEKLFDNYY